MKNIYMCIDLVETNAFFCFGWTTLMHIPLSATIHFSHRSNVWFSRESSILIWSTRIKMKHIYNKSDLRFRMRYSLATYSNTFTYIILKSRLHSLRTRKAQRTTSCSQVLYYVQFIRWASLSYSFFSSSAVFVTLVALVSGMWERAVCAFQTTLTMLTLRIFNNLNFIGRNFTKCKVYAEILQAKVRMSFGQIEFSRSSQAHPEQRISLSLSFPIRNHFH